MTNGETMVIEINDLDVKGSGQAVTWRENEQGNLKKLRLTIPQTLPGEKVRVTVDQPERRRRRAMAEEILEPHPERIGLHVCILKNVVDVFGSIGTTKVSYSKRRTM